MQKKINYILLILAFTASFIDKAYGQEPVPTRKISFPLKKDSIIVNGNDLVKRNDTTKKDSLITKETLSDIVTHKASRNILIDVIHNIITLYDQAEVDYQDVHIKAGVITINNKTNIVTAKGIVMDSLGYTQLPVVTQGGRETTLDSIVMNSKTKRTLAFGTKSKEGELFTSAKAIKRMNDSTLYADKIRVTTSKKKNPDYYIQVNKAKVVPGKKIVAGASQLYIADVPTPAVLPFAYFPLTKGRTSGVLIPSYGENNNQGYFLQNGGYYLAISDYVDLAILGDIYTNGSWGLRTESNYNLRYKFNGNFSFRYENLINSIKGLDNYSKTTNYNIRWSHSQDAKASPNSRFSASVNLGSSKYYRESLNEYNTNAFLNNTFSSSISYSKTFVGTPFNMSLSATHSQNANTEIITLSLPAITLNMNRIFPFAPKNGTKKNALQKIGLSYSMQGDYRINTTDTDFLKKEMFNTAQSGVKHNASISTNMKVFKYFTLSPSANYNETWYFDKISKTYIASDNLVKTDTINGFTSFREYNVGASLSTTVYGTVEFKNAKKWKAIRHTFRPSISYGYKPDFGFYYDKVQQSANPNDLQEYSQFDNGIYGRPSKNLSNSIGITLANTLEAKLAPKDSTATEDRRISLLNNLNFSTSYNMAADSLKWSPVNMNGGTSFFNNKLGVNFGATLNPYAINANGTVINTFNINNGGSLFRLTSANLTLNYAFSSKDFDNTTRNNPSNNGNSSRDDTNSDGIFGENLEVSNQQRAPEKDKEVKTKLYHSKIPWDLRLAFSTNYTNNKRQNEISSNSLMFSGNIELTPKWKVGVSSGYDFRNKGFSYTQFRFQRDLDSWRLSFNWVPFGTRQTYYFFIGVKSSVLSDLKYDQRQKPDKRQF